MAVYRVTPRDDDTDTRQSWKVHKDGVGMVSSHTKKSAAKRKARREAGEGDSIVLHRVDGTVMSS